MIAKSSTQQDLYLFWVSGSSTNSPLGETTWSYASSVKSCGSHISDVRKKILLLKNTLDHKKEKPEEAAASTSILSSL